MSSRRDFLRWCAALSLAASRPAFAGCNRVHPESSIADSDEPPSGSVQPGRPEIAHLNSIDKLTRSFLERAGVTAGQLAVSRSGILMFTRAYGTKPPYGYSPLDARSLFRIASCSKMFTCAAIDALHTRNKLDMKLKVFPFLGI